MKRLTIVTHGDKNTASTRYRVLNVLPFLNRRGVDYQILNSRKKFTGISKIDNPFNERLYIPYKARRSGRVLVQKRLLSPKTITKLSCHCKLLFDFDDAIYVSAPWDKDTPPRKRRLLNYTLSMCDKVLVGSENLKKYASRFCTNVKAVPTPVKKKEIRAHGDDKNCKTITVGWIGHPSNLWYLKNIIKKIDNAFSKTKLCARLKIVSRYDKNYHAIFDRNYVNFEPWSLNKEAKQIESFDVVIRPLTNDEWSISKGGFTSVVECMSYGVPVVASNVHGINELITHGRSGYLIEDQKEWSRLFDKYVREKRALSRMGTAAIREVGSNRLWLCQRGPEIADFICE